jgi:hypothetical protein
MHRPKVSDVQNGAASWVKTAVSPQAHLNNSPNHHNNLTDEQHNKESRHSTPPASLNCVVTFKLGPKHRGDTLLSWVACKDVS